jgi:hypothetical protein
MNMRRFFNSCRDHRENISLLASSVLPEAEQAPVRDHLAHCDPCRQYYEEMAKLTGELQQWERIEPPVQPGAAFSAGWMRSIHAVAAPSRAGLPAMISRCGEWLWPSPLAWGGLAAVWVCLLLLQWAAPASRATGSELARSSSGGHIAVIFAQRQRELSSLLESLAPPSPPSKPDAPRPRSQRRAESVTI